MPTSKTHLVISCEHASNEVPRALRKAFADSGGVLATHRGYDPGAAPLARAIGRRYRLAPILGRYSRLVIDLNRSLHHPKLYSEWSRTLPAAERARLAEEIHAPHRTQVEAECREAIATVGRVVHIAVHSFTPVLDGVLRVAEVGLLYDPRRRGERAFADVWKAALAAHAPELRVRRNYPYRGDADGLTTHLRTLFPDDAYCGLELELNQAIFASPPQPAAAAAVVAAFADAVATAYPGSYGTLAPVQAERPNTW